MYNPKQTIVKFLRETHLLQLVDFFMYLWDQKKYRQDNRTFTNANPDFRLPPSSLVYDACGHTNWRIYYQIGREHAEYISTLIKDNIDKQSISICEWGCGPARLLRHLPDFFSDRSVDLYGFDYNPQTIEWCHKNISTITFFRNSIAPPLLQCESNSFDCIYCLSVFTHLSRDMHFQWIDELSRVVKPNGLVILTTHGDSSRANLLSNEVQLYDKGELVVRNNIREGKRLFVAYHPPSFVRKKLLRKLEVVSHFTEPLPGSLLQDVWIVKNCKDLNAKHHR